jgi:hypothetical protein
VGEQIHVQSAHQATLLLQRGYVIHVHQAYRSAFSASIRHFATNAARNLLCTTLLPVPKLETIALKAIPTIATLLAITLTI